MSYSSLGYPSTAAYFGLGADAPVVEPPEVPSTAGIAMSDILPGLLFVGLAAVGIGYLLSSRPSMRANKRRGRKRGRKYGRKRGYRKARRSGRGRRSYRGKKRGRGRRKARRYFKAGIAGMKRRAMYGRGRKKARKAKRTYKRYHRHVNRHGGGNAHAAVWDANMKGGGGGAGWASPKAAGGRGWGGKNSERDMRDLLDRLRKHEGL